MASVINSARTSTSSVFGLITSSANSLTQLVSTATSAIDALDEKAQLMSFQVKHDCRLARVHYGDIATQKAAADYCDAMEEIHHRNFPDSPFDRATVLQLALQRLTESVNA